MIRLFCATTYIYRPLDSKFLLMDHKKLKKWLPSGGKIDPNELPDHAAIREAFEETGLRVTLIGEKLEIRGGLMRPYGMQVNVVSPQEKEHIDFIYLAIAEGDQTECLNPQEANGLRWFSIIEILEPQFNTDDTVRYWVKKFKQQLT